MLHVVSPDSLRLQIPLKSSPEQQIKQEARNYDMIATPTEPLWIL